MKYREYELELDGETVYRDSYVLDLSPHPVDRTGRERCRLFCLQMEAVDNFNAVRLGHRLFFKTDENRKAFITWMLLRWA